MDELCDKLDALHVDNNAPRTISPDSDHKSRPTTPIQDFPVDTDAVRHQWAPQFRPDLLPTSKRKALSQESLRFQTPTKPGQGLSSTDPSVDILPSSRRASSQYPLSAFLKDLVSPAECQGHRTPKRPPPPQTNTSGLPPTPTFTSLATPAESAAAAAACCALVLRRSISSSSNAMKTPAAVPTTSPLSTNKVATVDYSPAFDNPTVTPSSLSISSMLPLLPISSPPVKRPSILTLLGPGPSPVDTTTAISKPSGPSMDFSRLPLQKTSTAYEPHPLAQQTSPFRWHDTSEGITVFHASPTALVTAPATSPYPFVHPPKLWAPETVSQDLFKDTASVAGTLRRRFALNPPSPEAQVNPTNFLDMGHAKNCWCTRFRHREMKNPTIPHNTTLEGPRAEPASEGDSADLHTSSVDVIPNTARVPESFGGIEDDTNNALLRSDDIPITSSSESFGSEFEESDVIEGQPVKSDSDNEEWFLLSPRLRMPQQIPSPTSWTVSDVSERHSNTSPVYELSAALSSPQQTPTVATHQARVSDDESETN